MNDHFAEAANDTTAKFYYFSMKTKKCYMEDKKTHKLPKDGLKTIQVTSSNYVMATPCLISNNGIREESSKKVVSCDFVVVRKFSFSLNKIRVLLSPKWNKVKADNKGLIVHNCQCNNFFTFMNVFYNFQLTIFLGNYPVILFVYELPVYDIEPFTC